jgi:hypothetical protein
MNRVLAIAYYNHIGYGISILPKVAMTEYVCAICGFTTEKASAHRLHSKECNVKPEDEIVKLRSRLTKLKHQMEKMEELLAWLQEDNYKKNGENEWMKAEITRLRASRGSGKPVEPFLDEQKVEMKRKEQKKREQEEARRRNPGAYPPHLPLDILQLIPRSATSASAGLAAYRALLAVPRFARSAMMPKVQLQWQEHFTYSTFDVKTGIKTWFIGCQTGKHAYHRIGGPAILHPDGSQYWYRFGELHRTGSPAISLASGYKAWYHNGKLHCASGPAISHIKDGRVVIASEYYIHGKKKTRKEVLGY